MKTQRRGSATIVVLVLLASASGLLAWTSAAYVTRARALQARDLRVRARELALGAGAVPVGGVLIVDGWRLSQTRDGQRRIRCAEGPRLRYDITDDANGHSEQWHARP